MLTKQIKGGCGWMVLTCREAGLEMSLPVWISSTGGLVMASFDAFVGLSSGPGLSPGPLNPYLLELGTEACLVA